ncbi:ester cyclase [Actinoplanes friuliensis]|uniref:Ester cyclase n=1 Tax=Actinoplanes friuliensis DSM 7358 TaxID=1246995 RepID=U5VTQ6_9ACTN|nr:ester cyclase [Actinoplanes friuliensis]AGZ40383.1 hypothetical protein AFR_10470 [Actinoplanes friuliensis DSM 7358]
MRRTETEAFYRHYLATCNAHAFDRLNSFVVEDVEVNDAPQGLATYVAGLRGVVQAFPDYHWHLTDLIIDADRLAARLIDTGTHQSDFLGVPPTGRAVRIQEFAVYHLREGRIAQVWVTADNMTLLDQLR